MSTLENAVAYDAAQSYTYASAYAIQTTPITDTEEDGLCANFLGTDGLDTTWPCDAMYFDDPEHALAKLWTLHDHKHSGGYPRVVRLNLCCKVEAVKFMVGTPQQQSA